MPAVDGCRLLGGGHSCRAAQPCLPPGLLGVSLMRSAAGGMEKSGRVGTGVPDAGSVLGCASAVEGLEDGVCCQMQQG